MKAVVLASTSTVIPSPPHDIPFEARARALYHYHCLQVLATVQSAALALHTCHQCWMLSQEDLGEEGDYARSSAKMISEMFRSFREYLHGVTESKKVAL